MIGEAGRATEMIEQQIGGEIVAEHHGVLGGEADTILALPLRIEQALGARRVRQQIGAREGQRRAQRHTVLRCGQRLCREQQLEGRAHRKTLVGAVADDQLPELVGNGNAQPTAAFLFQCRDPVRGARLRAVAGAVGRGGRRRAPGQRDDGGERQGKAHSAPATHQRGPCMLRLSDGI